MVQQVQGCPQTGLRNFRTRHMFTARKSMVSFISQLENEHQLAELDEEDQRY